MATTKQALGAVLDGVVISTVAVGAVTRELAGTAVDASKQSRKLVNLVGSSIDYGAELMDRELAELKLSNASEMKYLEEIYSDAKTQKLIKDKMTINILSKYEPDTATEVKF